MATMMMANQAVAVAGLGSFLVRGISLKGLHRPLKMSKSSRRVFTPIRAAKLPQGILELGNEENIGFSSSSASIKNYSVETPRDGPKLPVSFWGFTENAEVWNSRSSMIGIFGIIMVEAIINKGILQAIGIDVGNGLDLPL